jgi:hypothetical protein
MTLNSELWTLSFPLYSIKPSFLNLFMKKLTRGRVVPIISASVSWLIFVVIGSGVPSLPKFASSSSVRAKRFSLEQMVYKVRLSATIAGQQMSRERLSKGGLGMKDTDHLGLLDAHHRRVGHGSGRCQAQRLRNQAPFAKKIPLAKQRDDRFSPLLGDYEDFDLAARDVEVRIGCVALAKYELSGLMLNRRSPATQAREEYVWIKRGLLPFLTMIQCPCRNPNLRPESYHWPIEQARSLDGGEAFCATSWRSVG